MKSATVWQAGYTIVEVMIFLTISGALLIGAFGLFNGRIQRTQFTQGVQQIATRIQNTANEVSTGTFPDNPSFVCSVTGNSAPAISVGTAPQGTQSQCIFVGKVINLTVGGNGTGCTDPVATSNCQKADVYTAVGRRTTDGTTQVTTLTGTTGAFPRLVVGNPNITQSFEYGNSIRVTGVYQETTPLQPISGIGLFQSFGGTYNAGNLKSGAQNVQLWLVRSTTPPVSPVSAANEGLIVSLDVPATPTLVGPNPNPGILICVAGGTNQKAAIRLDPSASGLTPNITMDDPKC
jgi:Tfp pilus assembly protein FimT